jgi:type IV secretion system protein VirD4
VRHFFVILAIWVVVAIGGYPIAFLLQHGANPDAWPHGLITPWVWFGWIASIELDGLARAYTAIYLGRSAAFAGGGIFAFRGLAAILFFVGVAVAVWRSPKSSRRENGIHGNARWANARELAELSKGLELGRDPITKRPVRIQVEGNLATIAPPRSGKSAGLVIPNLAFPEPGAWAGPAVVIDPKGEAYRAVRQRREALGRKVLCFDPLNVIGGQARWNPLANIDPSDVSGLYSIARALLPNEKGKSETSAFFRNSALSALTGALLETVRSGRRSLIEAADLIENEEVFLAALEPYNDRASKAALGVLKLSDKTRGDVLATASQAFQFLIEDRCAKAVSVSSFELADLSRGDVDLFIVLPADQERAALLAPLVRCLLASIFESIRKNRPSERIVFFIDEAAVLGRFDALIAAAGELPGYGASLWTIWQSRHQIVENFGDAGAEILLGTASVVNLFNLTKVQPDEARRWSEAVGSYTDLVTSTSTDKKTGVVTESKSLQAIPLAPTSDITSLPGNPSIVFINSDRYTRYPLKLKKTAAFADPRFKGLIAGTPPVGVAK